MHFLVNNDIHYPSTPAGSLPQESLCWDGPICKCGRTSHLNNDNHMHLNGERYHMYIRLKDFLHRHIVQ